MQNDLFSMIKKKHLFCIAQHLNRLLVFDNAYFIALCFYTFFRAGFGQSVFYGQQMLTELYRACLSCVMAESGELQKTEGSDT